MQLLDNFLPKKYQDYLEYHFLQPHMSWNYYTDTVDYNMNNKELTKSGVILNELTKDSPQLVHTFLEKGKVVSDKIDIIQPFLFFFKKQYGIDPHKLYRIKLNLMFQDKEYPDGYYNPPHTDVPLSYPDGYKVFLYYPIDSDGDTLLFNEDWTSKKHTIQNRKTPRKGNAIIFDAKQLHCSTPPKFNKHRLALNIVYHV
jgi:hypothetical protein